MVPIAPAAREAAAGRSVVTWQLCAACRLHLPARIHDLRGPPPAEAERQVGRKLCCGGDFDWDTEIPREFVCAERKRRKA